MSDLKTIYEKYEPVIGLEVHAQLLTKSKMFCSCPNEFSNEVNTFICPVCTGQPGTLPVVNRFAIELGIRAALITSSQIRARSVFARKNYFYPDLPKGYQISQYEQPFCEKGYVDIVLKDGTKKRINLTRIHFEEDAGKSVHKNYGTVVNLNRAGVPLIEIVSEPDMRTPEEAGQYLRILRSLLRYAEVCDGNMEEGSLRCDANVSVRLRGEKKLGTKVELKNINSFKFVEKAIEFEIGRHVEMIESGKKIIQESRSWDSSKNQSEKMRDKEEAHDYRYFPEPDLPPLKIEEAWIHAIKAKLPELPEQKADRFAKEYHLSEYDAGVLTSSKELADYFDEVAKTSGNAKASANWVMNELLGKLNAISKEITQSPVSAKQMSDLVQKISSGEISGKMAKTVFEEMFESGKDPSKIIQEKGLAQISDAGQLESIARKIIQANPTQVQSYKGGKTKLLGFFVGQMMKETQGQANPELVNQILQDLLNK